ncbi:bifunctional diguanylate cyclase/phosphodiesterase [Sulfurimonas autotrophica]|uniref:Diguanylate cyclase/phosphodiesterase n=1 Tax=Sulfurimonas autotrophica (strain ATCC BAA-671 / DSM 16294 / JCM 11897 / OK10) TaxID=563040 RepID=E0URQ7_SULAO|nr:EAL domain-containing protein [Sulfurimonas autotrophica]ADN09001.1 diguanylate cyclase/phosphodiesterase [Sulfurimonas autotrophica DSM 16294]
MNQLSRIIVVALLLITIFFTGSYIYLTHKVDTLKNEKYLDTSGDMRDELQSLIKEKSEAILLVTLGLSANQNIKNVIKKKHYKNIGFNDLSITLQHYSSLQNVWFQLITPEGKSFYRSWTDKKGDNVSSVRQDIKQIILEPKVMSTISIGKYDMTFKAMVPIFDNGKFIGIIETLAKFYSITQKLKNHGNELLIVVDKSYKKQLSEAYSQTFVDDYYIANPFENEKLLHIVQKSTIEKYLKITTYMVDTENSLLLTTLQLPDMNGNPMGYFIIAKDLKKIDLSEIEQAKNGVLEVTLLILLLIIILFYYIYSANYKRLIQEQNEILESSVQEKTEELELQTNVLTFIAYHDHLTGLANKVLLLDRIEEAIKHAKTTEEQFSVFFLDLDKFKEVNDTYGHEIGDELLLQIKSRLKQCIKSDDTLARLGGDEFAILHKNATKISTINLIDNILIRMKKPFHVKNIEIFTSFSIGVALYPQDSAKANQLLRNAETAMYKAKDDGKNTYQFYDKKMTEMALQKIQLDADIRKALKNKEFVAYFQPKIDARNGKVVGFETLIRWMHPQKGMMVPDEFIPFCEETGLVLEIDKYMLIQSIKQIMKWQKEGLEFGKVSVNVSTKKIESSNYIEELTYIIDSLQFDTSVLELEILEGQIMKNPQKSIEILNKLRDLGISISIDDFGTGYSSLSYLKKLPVTKIKIDRSFVIDLPTSKDDVAIVRTIINLAENLKLEIIAEGVEKREQLDFLVNEGCYNIQGYYFSRPLPADECKEFIIAHSKGK